MSRRCGRVADSPGWSYCVRDAGHEGPCAHYPRPNEKASCNDGSCGRCGGCYEVMREEFNRAADERDAALVVNKFLQNENADLKRQINELKSTHGLW